MPIFLLKFRSRKLFREARAAKRSWAITASKVNLHVEFVYQNNTKILRNCIIFCRGIRKEKDKRKCREIKTNWGYVVMIFTWELRRLDSHCQLRRPGLSISLKRKKRSFRNSGSDRETGRIIATERCIIAVFFLGRTTICHFIILGRKINVNLVENICWAR